MNKHAKHYNTFIPAFSPQQMRSINNLVGHALLSQALTHRLVILRDENLANEFDLTPETWEYLKTIKAHNLEEFCWCVTQLQNRPVKEVPQKQRSIA